jgi:hypothetical protein
VPLCAAGDCVIGTGSTDEGRTNDQRLSDARTIKALTCGSLVDEGEGFGLVEVAGPAGRQRLRPRVVDAAASALR